MVHTANLLAGDCEMKTQGAYVQDFPLRTQGAAAASSGGGGGARAATARGGAPAPSSFGRSLGLYLHARGLQRLRLYKTLEPPSQP